MTIVNPAQLVAEFKKSGEFDRLRREMLAEFQKSDAINALMSRVEDIARQKLNSDKKLEYMPQEAVHRELMDELDRYPVVERAVGDFRSRSDASFSGVVKNSLNGLLRNDRNTDQVGDGEGFKKADDQNGIAEVTVSDVNPDSGVNLNDHSNHAGQGPLTTTSVQNDNMDIEGSSDESVIDVPNQVSVEPLTDNTEQNV